MAAKTLTVKEAAQQIGTTPRTLRIFLRHEAKQAGGTVGEDTPGKGGRYVLEQRQMKALEQRFVSWLEAKAPKASEVEEVETDEVEAEVAESDLSIELD
jgi:predicted transcriptional regulator